MKSKIEKLEIGKVIKSDRFWSAGMIIEKINQIIDFLNSQSQPEGKKELHHHFDKSFYCVRCGLGISEYWKSCEKEVKDTPEERYDTKEILLNGTNPLVIPPSAYEQAEKEGFDMKNKVKSELLPEDTPEEWVCPKCGFDDCYPYKNSEDFGLDYCPICSELVKLTTK